MEINLFDDNSWASLRPLTLTRPVADLRVGILTLAEKWGHFTGSAPGFLTINYLAAKYQLNTRAGVYINGSICPDERLFSAIINLQSGEVLLQEQLIIAYRLNEGEVLQPAEAACLQPRAYEGSFIRIVHPEDIFRNNGRQIQADYEILTQGRTSATISATNTVLGDQIFFEEGAQAECSTFNTLNGPIYIGKNSEVWEGAHIRGSFALCDDSQVKMGTKIYGQTTIGPHSRVGGEINNAVIWGYSNKGHEGYLGNSVMGAWCNIGADSNNSNLKNNYGEVKLWDYSLRAYRKTGLQFCGLIMGDHSKCGINTMFNTGTVVGVSANVFGAGYPPNFIPDFSWGGSTGMQTYQLEKMFETTEKVFSRKTVDLDTIEKDILAEIFNATKIYRQS